MSVYHSADKDSRQTDRQTGTYVLFDRYVSVLSERYVFVYHSAGTDSRQIDRYLCTV